MDTKEELLLSAIDEATVLGLFKSFCEKNNDITAKQRLRNILSRSTIKCNAVKAIFANEMNVNLTDEKAERMILLIEAFLKKSQHRENIPKQKRIELLKKQNYKCKFCNQEIDLSAHADHIVPFKFVGDELEDNLQMLCEHCNKSKNASIDYEIRALLHIV